MSASHKLAECPARESNCKSCGKNGYWAKVCRSKGDVTLYPCNFNDEILGSVTVDAEDSTDEFDIELYVNGTSVVFKIDCGADVTLVSEVVYKRINSKQPTTLLPTSKRFMAANDKPLNVNGDFEATLINNDRDKTVTIFSACTNAH